MGENYLIDTNVAIYLLDGVLPPQSLPFMRSVLDSGLNLSVITKIELLGWSFPDASSRNSAEQFVDTAIIYGLTDAVVSQTIALRKAYKIKLPDALIGATAMVYGLTLISRNDRDFLSIPSLAYLNPFSASAGK
jgi:predicted nucleic acid-binding protein